MGIRVWLGESEPVQPQLGQALCFALLAEDCDQPPLIQLWAESRRVLPRLDRSILGQWSRAWFSIFEVRVARPGEGLGLRDVFDETEVFIVERALSTQLDGGEWLAAFLIPVDQAVELEGSVALLGDTQRLVAVQAMLAERQRHGPGRRGGGRSLRRSTSTPSPSGTAS